MLAGVCLCCGLVASIIGCVVKNLEGTKIPFKMHRISGETMLKCSSRDGIDFNAAKG